MAQWLSWLERRPVTAEVTGSSPVWVVHKWTTVERLLCILCAIIPSSDRKNPVFDTLLTLCLYYIANSCENNNTHFPGLCYLNSDYNSAK